MSNYQRVNWTNTEKTPLLAEKLDIMDEGIDKLYKNISNPNLFINGNFQIWQNGTEFLDIVSGDLTSVADRWSVLHNNSGTLNITKAEDGLHVDYSLASPIIVTQVLEEETLNSLKGKTLTLSYGVTNTEYTEHTRQVEVPDADMDRFVFATKNSYIELFSGDTLNWVKLEVGTVKTPCVPDPKEPILLNNTVGFIDVSRKLYEVKDVNATSDTIIHLWTATENCWCYLGGNAAGDGQYVARAYLDDVNIAAFWNVWPTSILFPVKKGQTLTKGNGHMSATFYGMT